jgi:hypothetical protein
MNEHSECKQKVLGFSVICLECKVILRLQYLGPATDEYRVQGWVDP